MAEGGASAFLEMALHRPDQAEILCTDVDEHLLHS
jgi:hypothetical protein